MEMPNMSLIDLYKTVKKLAQENDLKEKAVKELEAYNEKASSLIAKPGSVYPVDDLKGTSAGNYFIPPSNPYYTLGLGDTVKWTGVDESPEFKERQAIDKKLQMKLFIHFAQLFVAKYPQWQLLPEPDDPFHKVKLVRPDIGASITSLYPDNQLLVYGAPDAWIKPRMELGVSLPVAKIFTQEFFGWALDVDTPDWVK